MVRGAGVVGSKAVQRRKGDGSMQRWLGLAAVLCGAVVLGSGCRTTTIDFEEPAGTTFVLGRKTQQFPVQVRMRQRTVPGTTSRGKPVVFVISDGAGPGSRVVAKGLIYVYKVALSDVDRLARNYFRITADKIQSLREGAAVTIEGLSADGGKELYRVVIGLDRESLQ